MPLNANEVAPPAVSWSDIDLQRDDPATEERRQLKAQLHQQLVTSMDMSVLAGIDQERLRAEVRRMAEDLCQRSAGLLSRAERDRLVAEVLDETFGLGLLEPLMRDPAVSDILINGHSAVYAERNGRMTRTNVVF